MTLSVERAVMVAIIIVLVKGRTVLALPNVV